MTHLEKMLREEIEKELRSYKHYDVISASDVATDLVPVIMRTVQSVMGTKLN